MLHSINFFKALVRVGLCVVERRHFLRLLEVEAERRSSFRKSRYPFDSLYGLLERHIFVLRQELQCRLYQVVLVLAAASTLVRLAVVLLLEQLMSELLG